LVLLAGLAGLVWFSIRVENSSEKDAKGDSASAPPLRRYVTRPIVATLEHELDEYVRCRIEALYYSTGLTLDETIARFLDERTELMERGKCAYRLARVGSPEAVAALLKGFQTAPAEQKAFLAQLLGSTGNPAVKDWLMPLLSDPNEQVVIGAIRGLAALGDSEASTTLGGILGDAARSESVRVEAALGLGDLAVPAARDVLMDAFAKTDAGDVKTQILNSLGKFSWGSVADVFQDYIAAADTPPEMRVAAVEALAHSTSDAVPFLMDLAGENGDAEVRASAAWAVSAQDPPPQLAPRLAEMTEREPDSDVRRRLYEALLPQGRIPAARLFPSVLAEEDIAARVAGFNVLGHAAAQEPDAVSTATFDSQIVPELASIATSPNSLNVQMRAVFALRYAQTPAARQALALIASAGRPQVATAARNGLEASE